MASPGTSTISIPFEGITGRGSIPTAALLTAMLRTSQKVSDLIFTPNRPPQIEVHGQLSAVQIPGLGMLTPDDTRRIASDVIGSQ